MQRLTQSGADHSKVLRALALLLDYPTEQTAAALPEIKAVLADDAESLAPLTEFLDGDLLDAQEAYVATFDRGRRTSLNLFEHVHGESRDRGQAMVDLLRVYEEAGLQLAVNQLPDYLPVFLEYVALLDPAGAEEHLNEVATILADIGAGLARRTSPWTAAIELILAAAGAAPVTAAGDDDSDDTTPAALDAAWESAPAFDGCTSNRETAAEQPIHLVRRSA
jgi:nitrate reductase molybdenum cofactor assembly chaperone NarJ/NarW